MGSKEFLDICREKVEGYFVAFIVYLVSTGGWERVKEIWDRVKYKDSEGE